MNNLRIDINTLKVRYDKRQHLRCLISLGFKHNPLEYYATGYDAADGFRYTFT